MAPHLNSVTVRFGQLPGAAFWDSSRQTLAVVLRLFDDDERAYPPSWARFGVRAAEFLTPDALVNHLSGVGLDADDGTVGGLQCLAADVARAEGPAELVGLSGDGGRWLGVRTPSGLLLGLRARIDHDDYGLCWGDTSPATVETARLICEQVFARRPGTDVESFALALTYEHLSGIDGDFSMDLASLCDWYLTDSEVTTGLGPVDLRRIRHRLARVAGAPVGPCGPAPAGPVAG